MLGLIPNNDASAFDISVHTAHGVRAEHEPTHSQDTIKNAACRSLAAVPRREQLHEHFEHLAIDAQYIGNALRFCNHACTPLSNLTSQTIFRPDAGCPALYYHALIADRDIPALTPLTWDYGMDLAVQSGGAGSVPCLCGAAECRGWLR